MGWPGTTGSAPAAPSPDACVLWHRDELPPDWQPAACSGLAVGPDSVLVGVAARLPPEAQLSAVLGRLAAISTHTRIVYIDPATGAARPLLNAATALQTSDPATRRADFRPDELARGTRLHMLVDDARSGEVVYGITVREAGPDAIELLVANESTVRWMGMTIAQPGQLASVLSVAHDDERVEATEEHAA